MAMKQHERLSSGIEGLAGGDASGEGGWAVGGRGQNWSLMARSLYPIEVNQQGRAHSELSAWQLAGVSCSCCETYEGEGSTPWCWPSVVSPSCRALHLLPPMRVPSAFVHLVSILHSLHPIMICQQSACLADVSLSLCALSTHPRILPMRWGSGQWRSSHGGLLLRSVHSAQEESRPGPPLPALAWPLDEWFAPRVP
jgi:hypothetical protein